MSVRITVPLGEKITRVRILRASETFNLEPLALEDFSDTEFIGDRPDPSPAGQNTPAAEVPTEPPLFTIEQVQEEVQTAYDRGFADGQDVASAVLHTEINTLTERLREFDAIVTALQQQYAAAIAQIEHVALDAAVAIARVIVGAEAERGTECVTTQIRAAMAQYHGKDAVTIRLHPTSLEALNAAGSTVALGTEHSRSITLVADSTVEPGGCILETALGTFDAQLRTQLERARQLLADQLQTISPTPEEQSNAI
ncbi:MAG: FliH/SctL family protein [Chlorobi bacterium]|nr:FliH/SctL family protein [Chlorobiota bacterium]